MFGCVIALFTHVHNRVMHFYHNVVWIHGLDSIQELELYLLVVAAVLEGEVLNAIF